MKTKLFSTGLLIIISIANLLAQSNFVAGLQTGSTTGGSQPTTLAACDTLFSFPTVDFWTSGITFDGTHLWSSGYSNLRLYKHDLTGVLIDSVQGPFLTSTGYHGGDMDFDGTNILLFIEETDTLYKLDPTNGNVISKFRIAPCGTNCFGVAFDGTNIWISNYSPQAIYKVDANTGAVLNSFSISTSSNVLPIKFINNKLYGLGVYPGAIFEIDTSNGNTTNIGPWCLGYSMGFCIANNNLWSASSQIPLGGTQRIYQFDTLLLSNGINPINESNSFQVFPNPSTGIVNFAFDKNIQNGTIEIINALGQTIWFDNIINEKEMQLKLDDVNNGICMVRIFDGERYVNRKLIYNKN